MKFKFLFMLFLFFPLFANAKIFDIPFISQVLPGDWNNTLNCGQTSYYMADKFLSNDDNLNSDDIKKIDDFLHEKFSDPIREYNGYYTDINKIKSIAENLGKYENVFIHKSTNDFEDIKKEIDADNLVIPLVRISMKSYLDGHFMLMIGFDEEYVYFNDPGKTFGKNKKYLIDDFLKVWKSQNYNYVVLKNKNNVLSKEEDAKKVENIVVSSDKSTIQEEIKNNIISSVSSIASSIVNNVSNIVIPDVQVTNNIVNNNENVGYGYGYGYGYGFNNQENESGGKGTIFLPNFEFVNKYIDKKLVIPLEFNFNDVTIDSSKYYFQMDYKINKDGQWENVFNSYSSNYYKYYAKQNNVNYFFRIRVCDLNSTCSNYKELSQKISLQSASDMTLIGYDGNDVVLDREEYFNICFDVKPDQVVLITKGTTIKLTPGCTIGVEGILLAMGEEDSKINITSMSDSPTTFWSFFKFSNSFGSFLNNVNILNGGYYYPKGLTYPAFIIDNSIVTLNNVDFISSMGQSGIYVQNNSAFYMVNSSVINAKTSSAVYLENSIGVLDNNILDNNLYGVYLKNVDERLVVSNNKISQSYFYPINGKNIFAKMENNYFINNKYNIISQDIDLTENKEYFLRKNIYQIKNAFVSNSSILNIEPGSVFKFEKNNGNFNIEGIIKSIGTVANPIVFTSIRDDLYGGDTDSVSINPNNGDWANINLNNSHNSVFVNNIFRYGGSYENNFYGMINIANSNNVLIRDSSFEKSYYGLNVNNSKDLRVSNCSIKNNFYGLYSQSSNLFLDNNNYDSNFINEIIK